MFIHKVCRALHEGKVEFAIVGGYAVALHGAVRGTVDLDIVLSLTEENFTSAENALKKLGLLPRLPVVAKEVFRFRREYIGKRNLVAWNFYHPKNPIELVDIIITHDLKKMRTVFVRSQGQKLPILAIPDLIRMKRASGRPQDLEDIKALQELKS